MTAFVFANVKVEAKKEIVACDEALANEAAAAAQAIRDDCENDLAEAIPALQVSILQNFSVEKLFG
jgi:dynein heavy chain